jgi:hypothetical protein
LNTNPVKPGSTGSTARAPASRGCGGGAQSTSARRISRTPKLLMPEPKNTGVWRPARNVSSSKPEPAPRTSSISSRIGPISCGNSASSAASASPEIASTLWFARSSPGAKRSTSSRSRW